MKRLPPNAARIGAVAGILLAINLIARLIARSALHGDHSQVELALWSLIAMVMAVGVAGFIWTTRRRVPVVTGDLFFAVLIASLFVCGIGPLVSGHAEYAIGVTVRVFALCMAGQAIGAAAGVLLAVTFGLDPTSKAWRSQASAVRKPVRKPARR